MNRYVYAEDNPLKFTDQTGHWIEGQEDDDTGYYANAMSSAAYSEPQEIYMDPETAAQQGVNVFQEQLNEYVPPSAIDMGTIQLIVDQEVQQGESQPNPTNYGDDGSGTATDAQQNTPIAIDPILAGFDGENSLTTTNTAAPAPQESVAGSASAPASAPLASLVVASTAVMLESPKPDILPVSVGLAVSEGQQEAFAVAASMALAGVVAIAVGSKIPLPPIPIIPSPYNNLNQVTTIGGLLLLKGGVQAAWYALTSGPSATRQGALKASGLWP